MTLAMGSRTAGRVRTAFRGLCGTSGLGAVALWVGGCAAVGAIGAAVLTGLFLGRMQASLAATAHSYAYSDVGSAQCVFAQPTVGVIQMTHFIGRLPGFFIVVFDGDGKAVPNLQATEPEFYATDVDIDFQTVPPTVTGTVKQIDGTKEFNLFELYPAIESASVTVDDTGLGTYDVRIGVVALGAEGDRLNYGLTWHAQLSSTGLGLEGDLAVDRVLTRAAGDEITIHGDGSFTTTKDAG